MAEKRLIIEDGFGMRRGIPADKWEWVKADYERMRELAIKAGVDQETVAKYTPRIVKDEE